MNSIAQPVPTATARFDVTGWIGAAFLAALRKVARSKTPVWVIPRLVFGNHGSSSTLIIGNAGSGKTELSRILISEASRKASEIFYLTTRNPVEAAPLRASAQGVRTISLCYYRQRAEFLAEASALIKEASRLNKAGVRALLVIDDADGIIPEVIDFDLSAAEALADLLPTAGEATSVSTIIILQHLASFERSFPEVPKLTAFKRFVFFTSHDGSTRDLYCSLTHTIPDLPRLSSLECITCSPHGAAVRFKFLPLRHLET